MIIRHERFGDEDAIEYLTIAAFADHPHSDGSEPAIIANLRKAEALSLSLVCEAGSDILGYLALSPVLIAGRECGWFGLGPVAVLPDYQRHGIGSALIRASVDWMKDNNAGGCVVFGDPNYYGRFGFAVRDNLVLPGMPSELFMALALSVAMPSGIVSYHPAFSGHNDITA